MRLYLSVIHTLARTIYSFLLEQVCLPPFLSYTHMHTYMHTHFSLADGVLTAWLPTLLRTTFTSRIQMRHSLCILSVGTGGTNPKTQDNLGLRDMLKLPSYFPAAEYVCVVTKMLNELEITKRSLRIDLSKWTF